MTRAAVVDFSTLVSNVLYSLASFPGAAGSAWPAEWTTATGSPAGTVTQDGAGFGVLQANNGSNWNASQPTARLTTVSSAGLELTARFKAPPTTSVPSFWPAIGIGITSSAAGTGYFSTGITMQMAFGNNTWSLINNMGMSITGDIAVPGGWVPGSLYGLRFQRVVTPTPLVQARLWLASAGEPTAWGYSGSSSMVTTPGSIGFLAGQGGDTSARPFALTALNLTDGT